MSLKKVVLTILILLSLVALSNAQELKSAPCHTFSIVARDPSTGEMGVAVQSHYFSVGPVVPWAEAGVGAVATQSLVDVTYGPLGLDLMRAGRTASEGLRYPRKAADDDGSDHRSIHGLLQCSRLDPEDVGEVQGAVKAFWALVYAERDPICPILLPG